MSIGLPLTLGGVGINGDLPAAVSYLNLTNQVVNGKAQVEVTWGNPASNFGGVAIIRKEGSAPNDFTDGVRVYDGIGTSCLDPDVEVGKTYFYRAFPYNGRRQVQTLGTVPSIVPTVGKRLAELPVGSFVKLKENGVGTLFYVAKHDYESGLNGPGRTLLVRKECYNNQKWNATSLNSYASSMVDNWLNSDYMTFLSSVIRYSIGTTAFIYTPGNGDNSKVSLNRPIFLLSMRELGISGDTANEEGTTLPTALTLQIAYLNGAANTQWTRSPAVRSKVDAWRVGTSGKASFYSTTTIGGIRPAFTLPADFLLNPTMNSDSSYSPMNE